MIIIINKIPFGSRTTVKASHMKDKLLNFSYSLHAATDAWRAFQAHLAERLEGNCGDLSRESKLRLFNSFVDLIVVRRL
jgi:IS1 family transposase